MRSVQKNLYLLIILLISFPLNVLAQNKTITGTVRDANDVVIGASVTVKGQSSVGTITDMDGNYTLSVPASAKELTFSYIGYETQTVAIKGRTQINVTLKESSQMLEEVVAIGYAKVKRKDLTGSSVSVGANDLKMSPVSTAAQALAGKAAGVNIVQQSGAPGSEINITVRGGTSITQGTQPLYIVDGFQMKNGLQNVDINDIESIDVMKDASATAIYGARGSNGVILITTKSGKSGKTEVSYNGFVSFDHLGKKLDLLGVEDYVKYQYEFQLLRSNQSSFANLFGGNINDADFYTGAYSRIHDNYGSREGIDWQDEVFGSTGITQNHNVNITGGTEKTKYMISYNYTDEDGIMAKHGYQKNSIRAKVNHELWKGVRFDFSSSLQMTKVEGGGSLGGKLKQTILQPVTGGVQFTNEQLLSQDLSDAYSDMPGADNYDINNPLLDNEAIDREKYTRFATVNAGIEIDIIKNLTWRTAASYMWQQVREDYWDNGSTRQADANQSPYGYGYRNNDEKYSWQVTNTLNYAFDLDDHAHDFNILLGQETWYTESMNLDNEYRKFTDGNFGLNDVSMGEPYTWKSGKSREGLVSVFGRLSYNFKERYLFTGTLRADGSSKFAKGNQWGIFPSASAAWRISEEAFLEDVDFLDNLKLRVGYGTAGNNNIDNNMYATSYGSGHYGINGSDYITYVPGSTLGNSNLKWEKTTTTNVGLDISVLGSRVNLSVDFYNNESSNLLIKNKIPTSTGYSAQYQNIGAIRNRGVELVLNTTNIRTKDFTWNTDFNIAFNRSKVLELYGNKETNYFIQDYESRMGYKIEVGKPLGQFYGLVYDGIYTTDDFVQQPDGTYMLKDGVPSLKGFDRSQVKPGDAKYVPQTGEVDENGNPVWSTNDRTVIGSAAPKFTGGVNNTFRYKGFDLSVFMNFSFGNDVFNMSTQRFIGPYLSNQNSLAIMNNRFTLIDPATGKEATDLVRLAELNPGQYGDDIMWNISQNNKTAISDHSSYYIEDGSYLRFSTITLGYTFPKAWIQNLKLNNARVYCTLNNIATITGYSGYDPEVSAEGGALTPGIDNSSYPRSKSWVVGVNLTF